MKFSDYINQKHAEQYRGVDDDMEEDFMDWWGELELEDLDRLAEGWKKQGQNTELGFALWKDIGCWFRVIERKGDSIVIEVPVNTQTNGNTISYSEEQELEEGQYILGSIAELFSGTKPRNYEIPGYKETMENLGKLTIRKEKND